MSAKSRWIAPLSKASTLSKALTLSKASPAPLTSDTQKVGDTPLYEAKMEKFVNFKLKDMQRVLRAPV